MALTFTMDALPLIVPEMAVFTSTISMFVVEMLWENDVLP